MVENQMKNQLKHTHKTQLYGTNAGKSIRIASNDTGEMTHSCINEFDIKSQTDGKKPKIKLCE